MSNLSIDPTLASLNSAALSAFATSGTQSVSGLSSLQGTQAVGSDSDGDGGVGPAASTHISRQSQLLNKLQQLLSQDPAKFKQVLTDAANQLNLAAKSATGEDQKFLTNLAEKFTKAANGDLSALQPPQQNASNPVASAYQQGAQTTLNGQSLNPLSQQPDSGASGKPHHHHHGGHGHASASTQQALQGVFQEINSALNGSSSSASSAVSAPADDQTTAQAA